MRPDTTIGPDEAKYRRLDVQRVQVSHRRRSCHAILAVRVFKHAMNWLLVLPKAGHELKAGRAA